VQSSDLAPQNSPLWTENTIHATNVFSQRKIPVALEHLMDGGGSLSDSRHHDCDSGSRKSLFLADETDQNIQDIEACATAGKRGRTYDLFNEPPLMTFNYRGTHDTTEQSDTR
jgi:hypothetical protein